MRKSFVNAYKFFKAHAGGIVGQTAMTAHALATAEHHAWCADWAFEWVDDESPDLSWCENCTHSHEVLGCVLKDSEGNVLASLWGITDADRNYGRVIEAELACEALHNEKETRNLMAL